MTSLMLRTTVRYMFPLVALFSVFLLLRGHDNPGGGFIGGVTATAAVALIGIAYGSRRAARIMGVHPIYYVGAGLLLAAVAGMWAWVYELPFLTALWGYVTLPGVGELKVGTPLLFDLGVYLAVFGGGSLVLLELSEQSQ